MKVKDVVFCNSQEMFYDEIWLNDRLIHTTTGKGKRFERLLDILRGLKVHDQIFIKRYHRKILGNYYYKSRRYRVIKIKRHAPLSEYELKRF